VQVSRSDDGFIGELSDLEDGEREELVRDRDANRHFVQVTNKLRNNRRRLGLMRMIVSDELFHSHRFIFRPLQEFPKRLECVEWHYE
jgi:hypothetical protein